MDVLESMGVRSSDYDWQVMGAKIISSTLDYMNGAISQPEPMDKETVGAAVVSKTLDYMNGSSLGGSGGISESYQLNKDVLSAAYSDVGAVIDMYS